LYIPSGIVLKGIGGFYYILSGEAVFECKARGIFRKNEMTPLPGDNVIFSILGDEKMKGNLDEILPRSSQLTRPAVSNIGQVITVIAVNSPLPDFLLLDKLLITAGKENINAVVCLNKIDLDSSDERKKIIDTYRNAGYKIILTSKKTNEGIEELKEVLKTRITVFAGQSGVGKSSLLNRIMDDYVMQTGSLSLRTERGKHTTRHAELIPLECGGFIVDTPGFSSFELEEIGHEELQTYYQEFQDLYEKCRFSGCIHINEPDCAVKEAVSNGVIDNGRYERYIELYKYLKQLYDTKYKKYNKDKEKK
jgi:ribosome small subunit-dependent GTPase A